MKKITKKLFFLFSVFLLSGSIYSNDTLNKKSSYFSYIELLVGYNLNQGSIGGVYYNVNWRPSYRVNVHLYSFHFFSVAVAGNYFTKSYLGDIYNFPRFNNFGRRHPSTIPGNQPPARNIDFDLNYYSLDVKGRITSFLKKRLQPFVTFGCRYNLLHNYGYNTAERDDWLDGFIIPNIKKSYVNYMFGAGVTYQFKNKRSGVTLEIESNNDRDYFTTWKHGAAVGRDKSQQRSYGGKFLCLFANIGYRYYF